MSIKKSSTPRGLPGVHPGLELRIREAEQAEREGRLPSSLLEAKPQRILRPSLPPTSKVRQAQAVTLGLLDPAYRTHTEGRQALAEQEPFRPGVQLDAIWDSLSEKEKIRAGATERFRLEFETLLSRLAKPWQFPHKVGGRLDARNLKRIDNNLQAEIAAYSSNLAPDSLTLLLRFVRETQQLLALALRQQTIKGVAVGVIASILRDLTQKLLYQEFVSRFRRMGDVGIRRIIGSIDLADMVYQQLARHRGFSSRTRLLVRVLFVHHLLGYTAYASRTSFRGGSLATAYSARIFTDDMERYRLLFRTQELEWVLQAMISQTRSEFPFTKEPHLAIIRAVVHMAPLAPHRVYLQIQDTSGVEPFLRKLSTLAKNLDLDDFDTTLRSFADFLVRSGKNPTLVDDIVASLCAFAQGALWQSCESYSGTIHQLTIEPGNQGALVACITANSFAQSFGALFDYGQNTLMKLTEACNSSWHSPTNKTRSLQLQPQGQGALIFTVAANDSDVPKS